MKEHQTVYYIEDGRIYSGQAIHIQGDEQDFTFEIDSYGTCEGQYTISSTQIGRTVFLDEAQAQTYKKIV